MKFDPKAFRGKKALVLGMGRSGAECANLLHSRGFNVLVSEIRPGSQLRDTEKLLHPGIPRETGGHTAAAAFVSRLGSAPPFAPPVLLGPRAPSRGLTPQVPESPTSARRFKRAKPPAWCRLRDGFAVKSPGMHPLSQILGDLAGKRIPVFSEMEIALAFCPSGDIWAVTGTNGKTTTTSLLGEILRRSGRKTHVCGNIGVPLSRVVASIAPKDSVVLEVSSYQLEDSHYFRPRIAAVLNISPEHVNHHGNLKAYLEAKSRVFASQGSRDTCIFNAEDPKALGISRACKSRKLYFGLKRSPGINCWYEKGRIHLRTAHGRASFIPPSLPGKHNISNSQAAALMAFSAGVPAKAVREAFKHFKPVPHRLETAARIRGVLCVNDSKATNVDSTLVALGAFSRKRLVLILGGLDKGAPYAPLKPLISKTVRAILTIGQASSRIENELRGAAPIVRCGTLEKAVEKGLEMARAGEVLLLSPACASFDQFRDFEERGERFKEIVKNAS